MGVKLTFDDNDTTGFVFSVNVCCDASVVARVLGLAIDDFHRDDTVRVLHRIFVFRKFSALFEPFYLEKKCGNEEALVL